MDPLSLILSALAAGASAGLTDSAANATKAAYQALRGLLRTKLHPGETSMLALDQYEAQPERWRPNLSAALTTAGADRDDAIIAAARKVMLLIDPNGFQLGKYNVTIHGPSQGSVIGDNSNVVQHFTQYTKEP